MKKQHGDTLVEVMIALAIIGSVIAISYATASRALRIGVYAQERTEALKIAEGQIEILKAAASVSSTQVYSVDTSVSSFCMKTDGSGGVATQHVPAVDLLADDLTSGVIAIGPVPTYDTACALGQDGRYKVSILRSDSGSGATERNVFTVRARWNKLGGGKDEVSIIYRLHERQFTSSVIRSAREGEGEDD